ncbi:MAG: winged helix-turn-helix domain-containing protein [Woeseiaceae bacterium]|nr:winged helix-turn-helix domain-containing protein [Woeseiaceae bacterium]
MPELESGFRLGEFEVRPIEGMIVSADGESRIEPKAMAVLLELARHGGELRSREQIQQVVWPRGFTTDDVLTRCIGQIRKALGDDPKEPRYLETLPRRGYRLLQQVTDITAARLVPAPARTERADKLIVLPFQYLASDEHDYIADGITELLIARLARLQGITVLSRTTSMHFRNSTDPLGSVAELTGARWVVEGSVLQSGNRLQIVVQLIDARTDAHLWADDYVRDLSDVLVLQNDIAQKVAAAIRTQLGASESTRSAAAVLDADAMRGYLRGRQLLSLRSVEALREAVVRFTRVCEVAPDYAPALASRAEARFMLGHYGAEPAAAMFDACSRDLEHALALDPDLAIALTCRGALAFGAELDFQRAESDLLRALQLMPAYSIGMVALANVYAVQQRFGEAMTWLERAVLVDPLDIGISMNVGDHYLLQRNFTDALTALDKALDLDADHRPSLLRRSWALSLAGETAAASSALHEIGPRGEGDSQWLEYAALVTGAAGSASEAREHYAQLERISRSSYVSPWSLARAAAGAGEVEEGMRWLREAKLARSTSFPFARVTPALDVLRKHPEFEKVVASPIRHLPEQSHDP